MLDEQFPTDGATALQRFEDNIPYRTRCGKGKCFRYDARDSNGEYRYELPKERAKEFPYLQMNYPHIDYICFDLDFWGSVGRADEMDMPGPTLTVVTKDSGHCHYLYELHDPVPRKHSKNTARLLKNVKWAYKEMLCADAVITTQKQLIKNALSPKWGIVEGYKPFTLSEMAESIPDAVREAMQERLRPGNTANIGIRPFEETLNTKSRNCSLFENGRFYAYAIAKEHSTQDSLYNAVLAFLEVLNDNEIPKYPQYFPCKVSMSELRGIAKSIAKWTYPRRYNFREVNSGAMALESMKGTYRKPKQYELELKRRRRLSAKRTSNIRREETERRIRSAIDEYNDRGKEYTVTEIAAAAGISRQTIYKRYKHMLSDNPIPSDRPKLTLA